MTDPTTRAPALTVWQPHATLIMLGHKRYETRHWAPPLALIGREFAIHAGVSRKTMHLCDAEPFRSRLAGRDLPIGTVLGTARLARVVRMTDAFCDELEDEERAFGHFAPGRFAWEFDEHRPLAQPLPYRGAQGVWWIGRELTNLAPLVAAGQGVAPVSGLHPMLDQALEHLETIGREAEVIVACSSKETAERVRDELRVPAMDRGMSVGSYRVLAPAGGRLSVVSPGWHLRGLRPTLGVAYARTSTHQLQVLLKETGGELLRIEEPLHPHFVQAIAHLEELGERAEVIVLCHTREQAVVTRGLLVGPARLVSNHGGYPVRTPAGGRLSIVAAPTPLDGLMPSLGIAFDRVDVKGLQRALDKRGGDLLRINEVDHV